MFSFLKLVISRYVFLWFRQFKCCLLCSAYMLMLLCRRYHEFYVLDQKLQEFHGNYITCLLLQLLVLALCSWSCSFCWRLAESEKSEIGCAWWASVAWARTFTSLSQKQFKFQQRPETSKSLDQWPQLLLMGQLPNKFCMVHSVSGWMQGVQVKLWDPLRTRAIPDRLRGVFPTRCYTNLCLPLPYLYKPLEYVI